MSYTHTHVHTHAHARTKCNSGGAAGPHRSQWTQYFSTLEDLNTCIFRVLSGSLTNSYKLHPGCQDFVLKNTNNWDLGTSLSGMRQRQGTGKKIGRKGTKAPAFARSVLESWKARLAGTTVLSQTSHFRGLQNEQCSACHTPPCRALHVLLSTSGGRTRVLWS